MSAVEVSHSAEYGGPKPCAVNIGTCVLFNHSTYKPKSGIYRLSTRNRVVCWLSGYEITDGTRYVINYISVGEERNQSANQLQSGKDMTANSDDQEFRLHRPQKSVEDLADMANFSSDGYWTYDMDESAVATPAEFPGEDAHLAGNGLAPPKPGAAQGIEMAIARLQQNLEEQEAIKDRYISHLQELQQLERASRRLIAKSPSMLKVLRQAIKAASVYTAVLVRGESGTGKGLIADLIHKTSRRCDGPLIKINCGYIPDTLIEGEIFGYQQGGFGSAQRVGKAGYLEMAEGGTLFLDEITDLPLCVQVKLLRFLEEGQLTRLGEPKPRSADVRILAATQQDVEEMVRRGKFNQDLYHRLGAVSLRVPALRERKECLPYLLRHYVDHFAVKYGVRKRLTQNALDALIAHRYSGNVRELITICERVVVMSETECIQLSDLPGEIARNFEDARRLNGDWVEGMSLEEILDEIERSVLSQAMAKYCNQSKAAAALSVSQPTIARKLNKHGIRGKS